MPAGQHSHCEQSFTRVVTYSYGDIEKEYLQKICEVDGEVFLEVEIKPKFK